MAQKYDRFLVQLSWSDLPYRYAAKEKIQAAGPLPANPYVEAFMEQFAGLDTDHKACFLFPGSFLSQFFVIMEICRNAESVRPVRNLFPDEEKDGFRANWRLRRTEIRTRLTAEGVIRPKWKHELTLFQAMRERYPDTLYQYRPEWLGRQSLDLYIPYIRTAIEYQGIQHYLPVAFFGGEEALEQRRELDLQKKELCEQNDVRLIEWAYDVEPTVGNIKRMLARAE